MIFNVLAADALVMSVSVMPPAEETCVRDIIRKEIAKLEFAIHSWSRLLSLSVQAVDRDNAGDISTCPAASIRDHLFQ